MNFCLQNDVGIFKTPESWLILLRFTCTLAISACLILILFESDGRMNYNFISQQRQFALSSIQLTFFRMYIDKIKSDVRPILKRILLHIISYHILYIIWSQQILRISKNVPVGARCFCMVPLNCWGMNECKVHIVPT